LVPGAFAVLIDTTPVLFVAPVVFVPVHTLSANTGDCVAKASTQQDENNALFALDRFIQSTITSLENGDFVYMNTKI
jgi:hypothetical protein